jgi:hypothetical protein
MRLLGTGHGALHRNTRGPRPTPTSLFAHIRCPAHGTPNVRRPSLVVRSRRDVTEDDDDDSDEEVVAEEYFEYASNDEDDDAFEDISMRFFLDSADVKEWERWAESGMFYGYTTNPSILKRNGVACTVPSMRQLSRVAFDLGANELQLQGE